jgi:hypothetical protein
MPVIWRVAAIMAQGGLLAAVQGGRGAAPSAPPRNPVARTLSLGHQHEDLRDAGGSRNQKGKDARKIESRHRALGAAK